ncbi:uncharacterized protein EI90DRAFT_65649 [Cantharellus anzutake]|uniref:uncharacterized protein n=1 Tax=Cantharellus anzutake TaxID=1750568 RepID=UPI001905CFFB|nr:uncharacterized protein EI90DRAFT_65649 [Cantharellus anzutake]KAF8344288.1 hypothetical protein EI90DRAFT_65649 [Cantharellus anzutake]
MDEPAFRLIYDSAIELRLTSNRNEEINITRLEQELDSPTRTDRTDNPSDYTLGGCTVVGPKIKSHNEPTTHDALSPLDADILSTSTHQRPSVPIPPASKDGGNGVVIPEMLIQPVSVASDLNFPDYSAGQTDVPTGRSSTACPEPKSLRPSPTPSSSEAPRRVPLAVDPSRIPTNAEQNIQQEPHTMRDSEEGDIFIKKPQLQGSPRSTPKPNSAPGGADRKPKKRKLNKHQRDKKKLAAKLVAERIQREDGSKGVIPLPTTTPLSVTTLSSPQRSPTGGEEQAIMEPDHEPLTILPTSLDATALSSLQRSPKVEEQLAAAEPNQETPTIPLLPGPLKGSRYFDLSEWEDIVSRGDMRLNHFSGIVYLPLLLDENPQRDWHYKIRLMDASEAKLTFDCYVENGFSHWVPPVEVGHAVILRNVKVSLLLSQRIPDALTFCS